MCTCADKRNLFDIWKPYASVVQVILSLQLKVKLPSSSKRVRCFKNTILGPKIRGLGLDAEMILKCFSSFSCVRC